MWEKGSDLKSLEISAPLEKERRDYFVTIEDKGLEWDAIIEWKAGDEVISQEIDSDSLRDFAYELLAMANRIDTRAGRPIPKGPQPDGLLNDFLSVFDPGNK